MVSQELWQKKKTNSDKSLHTSNLSDRIRTWEGWKPQLYIQWYKKKPVSPKALFPWVTRKYWKTSHPRQWLPLIHYTIPYDSSLNEGLAHLCVCTGFKILHRLPEKYILQVPVPSKQHNVQLWWHGLRIVKCCDKASAGTGLRIQWHADKLIKVGNQCASMRSYLHLADRNRVSVKIIYRGGHLLKLSLWSSVCINHCFNF